MNDTSLSFACNTCKHYRSLQRFAVCFSFFTCGYFVDFSGFLKQSYFWKKFENYFFYGPILTYQLHIYKQGNESLVQIDKKVKARKSKEIDICQEDRNKYPMSINFCRNVVRPVKPFFSYPHQIVFLSVCGPSSLVQAHGSISRVKSVRKFHGRSRVQRSLCQAK